MLVEVTVFEKLDDVQKNRQILKFTMDHDDLKQRRVLGQQCRFAFEAGQIVMTVPLPDVRPPHMKGK